MRGAGALATPTRFDVVSYFVVPVFAAEHHQQSRGKVAILPLSCMMTPVFTSLQLTVCEWHGTSRGMASKISRRMLGKAVGWAAAGSFAATEAESNPVDDSAQPKTIPSIKQQRFEQLARATVRIFLPDGEGVGSGYHFIEPGIIVTNAHVALDQRFTDVPIQAEGEHGRWTLKLLASSPKEVFDFAILRATGAGISDSQFLRPDSDVGCIRGDEVLYAGYPHGIAPLIVAPADITSPREGNTFSFNGMIHGGNSGGPIVSAGSLRVKGTVTSRRFFGDPQMSEIDKEMIDLQAYLNSIPQGTSITMMGIDFGKFTYAVSRMSLLTNALIRMNSTTGIGFGNSIEPVLKECQKLGLA